MPALKFLMIFCVIVFVFCGATYLIFGDPHFTYWMLILGIVALSMGVNRIVNPNYKKKLITKYGKARNEENTD